MTDKKTTDTSDVKVQKGADGSIKITQPKHTGRRRPNVTVLVSPDDFARQQVGGFVNFLRDHAIVGLAIGFAIGAQVQTLVKQLITSFVDPLSQLLFGKLVSSEKFTLHWHGRAAEFGWGAFLYALIDFLFVLFILFEVFKIFKRDKLDKPATEVVKK